MQGTRLPDIDNIDDIPVLKAGEYVKIARPGKANLWLGCSPRGEQGNLSGHGIEEQRATISLV